jgi:hypothetical protein
MLAGLFAGVIRPRFRSWQASKRVPSPKDEPAAILRKLARNKMGFYLPLVTVTLEGKEYEGFRIVPEDPDATRVFVAPPIVIRWQDAATPADRREVAQLSGRAKEPEAAEALAALMVKLGKEKPRKLVAAWKPVGALARPTEVDRDAVRPAGGSRRIIEEG